MNVKLGCRSYDIYRRIAEPVEINVSFVLKENWKNSENIADALKAIELYLCGGAEINIVKATDKPRCFYCGSLNDEGAKKCENCGVNF